MITYRVHGSPVRDLDLALAVTSVRVTKQADALWVTVSRERAYAIVRELARCGLRLDLEDAPQGGSGLVPAVGRSLAPLGEPALVDALLLEPVAVAESTAALLRRPWPGLWRRPANAGLRRCRAILHGQDALVSWERRGWLPPAAFRQRNVRAAFRPIVFDRAALSEARPSGRLFASEGRLVRWAFDEPVR